MATTHWLGSSWRQLVDELEGELRALDPDARLTSACVDDHGLLRFRARFSSDCQAQGRRLLREYEGRALTTCELCGEAGRVYAGPVLLVRCPGCAAH